MPKSLNYIPMVVSEDLRELAWVNDKLGDLFSREIHRQVGNANLPTGSNVSLPGDNDALGNAVRNRIVYQVMAQFVEMINGIKDGYLVD